MYLASSKVIRVQLWEKHDMANSQLKQNPIRYLIKLKIVKVVTNLEIIQPQFLIGQQFLVFDKRKLKKKSKIGTPRPT